MLHTAGGIILVFVLFAGAIAVLLNWRSIFAVAALLAVLVVALAALNGGSVTGQ